MRGIIIRFALIAAAAALVAIVATRVLAARLGRWVASVPTPAPSRIAAPAGAAGTPAPAPAPTAPDLSALHLTHAEAGFRATTVPARLAAQGLRRGDLLIAIDGQPVRDADALLQAGQSARGQPTLRLTFRRGTSDFEVTVDVPP